MSLRVTVNVTTVASIEQRGHATACIRSFHRARIPSGLAIRYRVSATVNQWWYRAESKDSDQLCYGWLRFLGQIS